MTLQHALLALLIGGFMLGTIAAAALALIQEWRRAEQDVQAEVSPMTVGRLSSRMDVPGKYPAHRTRRSRTLR